ncbi:diacylglycerol/lipid kinase family protein [Corynebacterium hindlerae]|uniref:diacylglycerol/lipid kinase family protein n=1 Tax=Corynebacterium hindlerae TaxID=699041 RepID=UPI003AAA874D
MRCLLLTNPNSTSLTERSFRAALAPLLAVSNVTARHTQHPEHAAEIVRGLTRDDYDAVIVFGGDGTVNEVISGLLGPDPSQRPAPEELPRVAVVPTGSANVFARALGFPNNPVEAAHQLADLMAAGTYRRLPVGAVNDRWFCVNVGFGMDAEVIRRMDKLRDRGIPATPWNYSAIAHSAWRKLRRTPPHIHFDAWTHEEKHVTGDVPFVIVSNTNPWTYAGPVPIVTNPEHSMGSGCSLYALSRISDIDGSLAIISAIGIPLSNLLKNQLDFQETRVDDAVHITLSSQTKLKWQVDGEYAGANKKLTIASFPESIDVICPKNHHFA